MEKDLKPRT